MEFKIQSEELQQPLQSIYGIISNNNAVPILSNFLLELRDGVLSITASDTETSVTTKILLSNTDITNAIKIAIPAKILYDIVKSIKQSELRFVINADNYEVEIFSGEGKYKIAGVSADEYPKFADIESIYTTILPSSLLFNAISKTTISAGNDDMRPQMTGVLFEQINNDIAFVGTDAHKLSKFSINGVANTQTSSIILPKKPLNLIKNIIGAYKDDVEVIISYNIKNATFVFDNYTISCRLIDGKYPNYDAAVPKDNPNKLVVDKNDFLTSLKRVLIFANQFTQQIRVKLNANQLELSSEDVDLSNMAKEKIECDYTGGDLEIGFNAKYLIEMLSNIHTESVLIEMSQPNRACILHPFDKSSGEVIKDYFMLVMPVMLTK